MNILEFARSKWALVVEKAEDRLAVDKPWTASSRKHSKLSRDRGNKRRQSRASSRRNR